MEKIKIAHLYYDLMNLYGENGNIMALEKGFNDQDMFTEVTYLTVNDKIDFNKYDIYYMGCGSEENQKIVIDDILKYKDKIKNAIENEKHFIFTGNSYELSDLYSCHRYRQSYVPQNNGSPHLHPPHLRYFCPG